MGQAAQLHMLSGFMRMHPRARLLQLCLSTTSRCDAHAGTLNLQVLPRTNHDENPKVLVQSTVPLRLVLQWGKSADPVGGQTVDRSKQPMAPLHQRIIALEANMTVNEAKSDPAYTPAHKAGTMTH